MEFSEGYVSTLDGTRLHWVGWDMDGDNPDADAILIVHGYAEHIRRYDHVAKYLTEQGFVVLGIDVRGHGRSEGERGYVERFDHYLVDVAAGFDLLNRMHPGGRKILLGHSNGGLISLRYALAESGFRPELLVLSGPLLKLAVEVPQWKQFAGRALSRLAPETALVSELNPDDLSTDTSVGAAYVKDPLVIDIATARYFTEMTKASADARGRAADLAIPTLLMHGAADPICNPEGSREVAASNQGIEFVEFEGMRHEIFNETEKSRVLDTVGDWLSERGYGASAEAQA